MTKKHFEAIAKIMKKNKPEMPNTVWTLIMFDLTQYFKQQNTLFDSMKFFKTCKGE